MPSPVPKPPEQRRNRNPKREGEWIDLPMRLEAPILEPANPRWPIEARRMWEAIRSDPISSQYTDADVQMLKETMRMWRRLPAPEQRLRLTQLGVTPKGRRDLRWRTELEAEQQREAVAKVRKLRVIGKEE